MYSSIEEEQCAVVIERCYWPLLNLTNLGIPIGLEASGLTLELIYDIDPNWLETLSTYIKEGKIEFIGSGYSQIIGPLVPAKVNDWNQKQGREVYKRLLGIKPKTALVNEMAFSAGIVEYYSTNGYDAIIMEWNNPRFGHPEWKNDWRYYPQVASGCENQSISLIWADSIAFQKFQRYAHGELEMDAYVRYLKTHEGNNVRFFPLYLNDAEIFNYRPGRYQTEAGLSGKSEWKIIIELYNYLDSQDWCEFVFPSDVLKGLADSNGGQNLRLESSSQPIPVKKQEKYNVNRWALTGKDDLKINSKCYQIYGGLINKNNTNPEIWRELCYLWSSDFRTHITEKRWLKFEKRLGVALEKWGTFKPQVDQNVREGNNKWIDVAQTDKELTFESKVQKIKFNIMKGLSIKEFILKEFSDMPLLGTLDHGYYDDITLGADYFSGHAVIERFGEHKLTDLVRSDPEVIRKANHIIIYNRQSGPEYCFSSQIIIGMDYLSIKKTIELHDLHKCIIRPINFTFIPEAWDINSLFIKTQNGGKSEESFELKGYNISHGDIYSSLISARHGFGNTSGVFIVGDKEKSICFKCNMSESALIPSIVYSENNNGFFFRLQYSAREMDETIHSSSENLAKIKLSLRVNAARTDITKTS